MNYYYVYYKIAPDQAQMVRGKVLSLFEAIEKQCGVRGRWMRRRDDPSTYMEVYEDVQDAAGFEAALKREGAKLGVERKLERFVCA
jgi:Domain of unknown function (DUF4936)